MKISWMTLAKINCGQSLQSYEFMWPISGFFLHISSYLCSFFDSSYIWIFSIIIAIITGINIDDNESVQPCTRLENNNNQIIIQCGAPETYIIILIITVKATNNGNNMSINSISILSKISKI